jgi:Protein of unknown function (DUF4031)
VTVYLDNWRQRARLGPVDDRWSHLIADTDEELHEFAARMGMRREWFQHKSGRPHHAHYDLPERARADALAYGAVEVTWRHLGRMLRDRRVADARPAADTRPARDARPGDGDSR